MKIIFTILQTSKCIFKEWHSTEEFYDVMNERNFPSGGGGGEKSELVCDVQKWAPRCFWWVEFGKGLNSCVNWWEESFLRAQGLKDFQQKIGIYKPKPSLACIYVQEYVQGRFITLNPVVSRSTKPRNENNSKPKNYN